MEINLDKFSEIGSQRSDYSSNSSKINRSYTSNSNGQNNYTSASSTSKPLKSLIQEDFCSYLTKIKKSYPDFKFNHYSKYYEKVKLNTTITNRDRDRDRDYPENLNFRKNIDFKDNLSQNTNFNTSTYKSSSLAKLKQLYLPSNYLLPGHEFKLEKSILEMKRDECEFLVRDHIEKGGEIEMQVEKILSNSSMIHAYIENNLSLQDDIEIFLQRIKKYKLGKEKFRKFIIQNTNKLVLRGSKKKNLEKILNLLNGINEVKILIEKIKFGTSEDIEGRKFSLQEENELLNEAKEIIKNLKLQLNNLSNLCYKNPIPEIGTVVVINQLEKELFNHNNKSSEKIIDEFTKLFTNMMKSRVRVGVNPNDIDKDEELNELGKNINQKYVSIFFKIREKLHIEEDKEYLVFLEKLNILKIEENLTFMERFLFMNSYEDLIISEDFLKIKEILNVYFKREKDETINTLNSVNFGDYEKMINENLNNLISVSGPFSKIKKCFSEIIMNLNEILSKSINTGLLKINEIGLKNNEKGKLLLMIISKSFLVIDNNFRIFIKFISDNYIFYTVAGINNSSNPNFTQCNQVLLNFSSEIKKFYSKEMNKIIEPIVDSIFSNSINQLDIDNFSFLTEEIKILLKYYFSNLSILDAVNSNCNANCNDNGMFLKLQNEFVFQFFEEKGEYIRDILDREDWNIITSQGDNTNINTNKIRTAQLKINFLLETNFIHLKFTDKAKLNNIIANSIIINFNERSENFENLENSQNSIPQTSLLEIRDVKFKFTNSILDLINFIFDFVKLISHFDISLCETTVYQFVKILKFYLVFCKETIIEGEGVKRGKLKSISQKEISMLCANINIIEAILFELIKNFSSEYLEEQQEILIPSLNEILNYVRKLHIYCKEKINELFQFTYINKLIFLG